MAVAPVAFQFPVWATVDCSSPLTYRRSCPAATSSTPVSWYQVAVAGAEVASARVSAAVVLSEARRVKANLWVAPLSCR